MSFNQLCNENFHEELKSLLVLYGMNDNESCISLHKKLRDEFLSMCILRSHFE